MREEAARRRVAKIMENHYYECMYAALRDKRPPDETFVTLNRLRAKIVNLHSVPLQKVLCDTDEHDTQPYEQPTLFHVLRMQEWRTARVTRHIQDEEGQTHTSPLNIMRVLMTHFRRKYDIIEVYKNCIKTMTETIPQPPDMHYIEHLNQTIDIEEIRLSLSTGKREKAPGSDGLGRDFYKTHWRTIKEDLHNVLNQMYLNKAITPNKNME